ncbi:hypothetical protein RB195_009630 [Necator americanus]|uniref:Cytochrome c oxidase subunit 5A, mitochondrial n=1 Tax=Necator americanus TaxID=51031 RepID=A0ABR1CW11_NECAM
MVRNHPNACQALHPNDIEAWQGERRSSIGYAQHQKPQIFPRPLIKTKLSKRDAINKVPKPKPRWQNKKRQLKQDNTSRNTSRPCFVENHSKNPPVQTTLKFAAGGPAGATPTAWRTRRRSEQKCTLCGMGGMATPLVRSVARSALTRGSAIRTISTSNCLSRKVDDVMEKWPAEKFDKHFIDYLNRPEIDGWEVRKALTELHDYDVIPDPKIVEAGLRACRRVNDFSLCVRFLEAIKIKCGSKKNREVIYSYIIKEVKPVLDELGISTPEELGYDKPELFIPQPDYWWEKKWYAEYGYDKKPAFQY